MGKNEYGSNRPQNSGAPGSGMMRGSSEKAKNFTGTWKKLIKYSKKYYVPLVLAIIFAIGGTIMTLIGPDKLSEMTKVITDGITTGIDLAAVASIGITLVILYLCSFGLSTGQHWIMATVSQGVSKQMRSDISRKINRLPMGYFHGTSTGDVLSRVTNDVDMISQSLNQSVGMLVSAVTLFAGSLIMMLLTNVIMAATAVIATLIGFLLMMLIMRRSQKYFDRQQKHLGEIKDM